MGHPWEQRKLGEISTCYSGGTPKVSVSEYYGGKIPFIRSAEINSPITELFLTESGLKNSSAKWVSKGDLLYALYGATSGEVGISRINGAINQAILAIKPTDSINTGFLAQQLKAKKAFITNTYLQGGQGNLSADIVKSIEIEFPSLLEQNKIAQLFLSFENLITLHQRKLDLLKEKKKGLLQKMFPKPGENKPELRFSGFTDPWKQRKLGDLGTVAMCKRVFKEQTQDIGDIPFFKIGTFGGQPDAYITRELFDEYKSKYPYPEKGDILISASGSIGRTVLYKGEDAYFQDSNIIWFKHNRDITNQFLKHLYEVIQWNGLEGSTIKRLYNDNFLRTEIMLPSIQEQERSGAFFDGVDYLITLHQRKLDLLKEKKKGLLQKMFPKPGQQEPELRFSEFR